MFGKRGTSGESIITSIAPATSAPQPRVSETAQPAPLRPTLLEHKAALSSLPAKVGKSADAGRAEQYYEIKTTIFSALIDTIDLTQLSKLNPVEAREEIREIVSEILAIRNVVMSILEQEDLVRDICNDVLGYGPLEPLLARDEISDIMVNGCDRTYIEIKGKVQDSDVRFADNVQLMNICQRIVSQVGRRVDESSPICDARLPDGSRVNVIVPPLALEGPTLTIRKFKRDRLTLDQLVELELHLAYRAHLARYHRSSALQRDHFRRDRFRQDHAAQLHDRPHRQ